MTTDY